MGNKLVRTRKDFYGYHRFFALILGSMIVAVFLVAISMDLYYRSGASQLDLSRPGYSDVRSKVVAKDESFVDIPTTGAITAKVIDEFQKLYEVQAVKVQSIDAFGSDPLNPNALWLGIATDR